MTETSEVGRTAAAGWQIGVRRTVAAEPDAVWALLCAPEGMRIWLGGAIALVAGGAYRLDDGTEGEVRVVEPGSHARLTWRPPGWGRASVVQVRVIPAASGATIAFHQEHLPDAASRELMRARWSHAIDALRERLAPGGDAGD